MALTSPLKTFAPDCLRICFSTKPCLPMTTPAAAERTRRTTFWAVLLLV